MHTVLTELFKVLSLNLTVEREHARTKRDTHAHVQHIFVCVYVWLVHLCSLDAFDSMRISATAARIAALPSEKANRSKWLYNTVIGRGDWAKDTMYACVSFSSNTRNRIQFIQLNTQPTFFTLLAEKDKPEWEEEEKTVLLAAVAAAADDDDVAAAAVVVVVIIVVVGYACVSSCK